MAEKTPKQRRAARAASRRRRRRKNLITILVLLVVVIVAVLLLAHGCRKSGDEPETSSSVTTTEKDHQTDKTEPDENSSDEDSDESEADATASRMTAHPMDVSMDESDGVTCFNGIPVVNKSYSVPEFYTPANLVDIGDGKKLDSTCYDAFLEMAAYAYEDDVILWVASGYRDYAEQQELYNSYAASDGTEAADRYSARPGSSEHHTGLAIDLNEVSDDFGETPEGKWVVEHCAEYGFILRYPQGKEEQTGYMYEPWHIRYVGVELAQEITASGLCLEEYLGITSEYAE